MSHPQSPVQMDTQPPQRSALAEYHTLLAAGHFKPSSSVIQPPSTPRTSTPPAYTSPQPATPWPSHMSSSFGNVEQSPSRAKTAQSYYRTANNTVTADPRRTQTGQRYMNTPTTSSSAMRRHTATRLQPSVDPAPRAPSPHTPMPRLASAHYHPTHAHYTAQLKPNPYGAKAFKAASLPPPPPPTLPQMTSSMLTTRIHTLLSPHLHEFTDPNLSTLSTALSDRVIHLGRNGHLGPHGLQNLKDILMVVGHEGGNNKYMALAVVGLGKVWTLMRGAGEDMNEKRLTMYLEGKTGGKDGDGGLEWLREGFFNAAVDEWKRVCRMG
ncbi:hypothetical protein ACEQ8H_006542 [Pleosporales sp. CAS-2024a]